MAVSAEVVPNDWAERTGRFLGQQLRPFLDKFRTPSRRLLTPHGPEIVRVSGDQVAQIAAETIEQRVTQKLNTLNLSASIIAIHLHQQGELPPMVEQAISTLLTTTREANKEASATQRGIEYGLVKGEVPVTHQQNNGDKLTFDTEYLSGSGARPLGPNSQHFATRPLRP